MQDQSTPVIPKGITDELIRDYFIIKGMKPLYDIFLKESGCRPVQDTSRFEERSKIADLVVKGEIRAAVSRLNDIDSTIIRDGKSGVGFHLQKQALLEIIRQGKNIPEALLFAQQQVAPLAKDTTEFHEEIESIMTLLLYANVSESPYAHYLSDSQRRKTAHLVNSALLKYCKHTEKSKLETLMKMILWAQEEAAAVGIGYVKLLDLRTAKFDAEATPSQIEMENEEDMFTGLTDEEEIEDPGADDNDDDNDDDYDRDDS